VARDLVGARNSVRPLTCRFGQGHTVDEARTNLAEALALCFEDEPSDNRPEPPIITPVDVPA
jgi:predicted RNase H-like HicB family nuclease